MGRFEQRIEELKAIEPDPGDEPISEASVEAARKCEAILLDFATFREAIEARTLLDRISSELTEAPKLAREVYRLELDGKLKEQLPPILASAAMSSLS